VEVRKRFGIAAEAASDIPAAVNCGRIVVTSTPSRQPFLRAGDIAPGAFIAAVGADSATKHEIDPELMGKAFVVVDDLDQCSRFGDLHHALLVDAMRPEDVRGSLDQVITGRIARPREGEIVVFDSTGVAIEDVAAAALAYERAEATGAGTLVP
jgi:ornithine cyclodeaminase/alanine dehydrogenase-like protein (mu-crystallin family)